MHSIEISIPTGGTISFDPEPHARAGAASITFTSADGNTQWGEFLAPGDLRQVREWADEVLTSLGWPADPVQRAALVAELQEIERRLEALVKRPPTSTVEEAEATRLTKDGLWNRRNEILDSLWPVAGREEAGS